MDTEKLVGKQFSRLTILKAVSATTVLAQCSCGNIKIVNSHSIGTPNGARSCGCLQKETASAIRRSLNKPIHGKFGTPIYNIWAQMKARCINPKSPNWKRYGGRGIKVCKRWLNFIPFYEDMGDPPTNLQLDRKNNDGNYCKSNCRWATRSEQAINRRPRIRNKLGQYQQ